MFESKSLKELLKLQSDIETTIKTKISDLMFWEEQAEIMNLIEKKNKIDKTITKFVDNTSVTKRIEEAGYSITTHDYNRVSILNFSHKKDSYNHYYGFEFTKEGGLKKTRDDVLDEDLEIIKNILSIKNLC